MENKKFQDELYKEFNKIKNIFSLNSRTNFYHRKIYIQEFQKVIHKFKSDEKRKCIVHYVFLFNFYNNYLFLLQLT